MPEISVIMLTYNREKFIERAVKSVLRQTFQNFEFIIVNNGSTDNSRAICDSLAKQDSRITVIHKEKGNIGSGRNAGLDYARGNYVAFIDDDDYCMPGFLQFLYDMMLKYQADISACGSYVEQDGKILPNGNYLYEDVYIMNPAQAIENFLWRRLYNCAMPTKLMNHELFEKIRFSEEGVYDDIATTYKYFANAKKIVAEGNPQYVFCRHHGNTSGAATKHHLLNPNQLQEYLQVFHERTEYLSSLIPELSSLARYSEWSYMISMIEKINRFQLHQCEEIAIYMKSEIERNLDEFVKGPFILDFEKEWIRDFILNKGDCLI